MTIIEEICKDAEFYTEGERGNKLYQCHKRENCPEKLSYGYNLWMCKRNLK